MSTDPQTLAAYERGAAAYRANRTPHLAAEAAAFVAEVAEFHDGDGDRAWSRRPSILDLGCGTGQYLPHLGPDVVGVDPVDAVARLAADHGHPVVRGFADAIPMAPRSVTGVWARNSLLHLSHQHLPAALADIQRTLVPGGRLFATVLDGEDGDEHPIVAGSDLPGRTFYRHSRSYLSDVLTGAGFVDIAFADDETSRRNREPVNVIRATRDRTLPDTVGPDLQLLVCGLNPSLHAADAGVGFVTANNRFWPAARAAGVTTVDRDAHLALRRDRLGMTDLVKRATRRADELSKDEYVAGVERVARLCARHRPLAVCMVGLAGWRAAVNRRAVAGWQPNLLGGSPVYVMPSTSGLNAHAQLDDLTDHLRRAVAGPT